MAVVVKKSLMQFGLMEISLLNAYLTQFGEVGIYYGKKNMQQGRSLWDGEI